MGKKYQTVEHRLLNNLKREYAQSAVSKSYLDTQEKVLILLQKEGFLDHENSAAAQLLAELVHLLSP